MLIVRLEEATSGRYFVHMEDGLSFPVGRKESRNLELAEGKELTQEQLEWIMEELVFPRGRNYLICLLASRDYTEKEVADKLKKAHYPDTVICDILEYGRQKHYLDDFRYAEDYIALHKSSRSIRQLKYQLSMKGVSDSILRQIDAQNDVDELFSKVKQYWEKSKGSIYEKNGKTYQYFARKGYDTSIIKQLICTIQNNADL